MEEDSPSPVPEGASLTEIQAVEDGVGPLVHRLYWTTIRGAGLTPEALVERIAEDLDRIAPSEFATFQKLEGENGKLRVGDAYVVRMPGPWDGPVRVIDVGPSSFRLATLEGHLEAGQIEFRAARRNATLEFAIESWARSGDRLSDLLYTHLRMSKEVQLHMWTTVLERVAQLSGGEMSGGISVITRRGGADDQTRGTGTSRRRELRLLADLASRPVNFGPDDVDAWTPRHGWHVDDMTEPLPAEASGDPVQGGTWETARSLMLRYQVADPAVVRATYRRDAPLAGRDMLLQIRFAGLRLHMGVRVGEVYDETREVDGRQTRVFGWNYRTLEGHFEQGQMHYEIWKWLDTGDVDFRLHAYSRAARTGPLLLRAGFLLIGRQQQLAFYRQVCRRMRRLTEAELELRKRTTQIR